jgi:hypothetical protein
LLNVHVQLANKRGLKNNGNTNIGKGVVIGPDKAEVLAVEN